jgi:hypothetical protein
MFAIRFKVARQAGKRRIARQAKGDRMSSGLLDKRAETGPSSGIINGNQALTLPFSFSA